MLQNFTYYAQFMLHILSIVLYKFNILFLLSNLNYKIMSISNLSSSSTVQHTINNSSIYVNKHFDFIFVAFAMQISQPCEKCAFYTNFVNCTGNFCLLCLQYAQCFCFHIMLKIMLA